MVIGTVGITDIFQVIHTLGTIAIPDVKSLTDPKIIRLARKRMLLKPVTKPPEKLKISVRGSLAANKKAKASKIVPMNSTPKIRIKPSHR
jgi:hypothetical protein